MTVEHITADAAVEAIERCAFDAGGTDEPRMVVHCFSGGIGCDWDTADAIETVRNAYVHEDVPQIAWMDSPFGRCLHVVERVDDSGGRQRMFDTVTPEVES